MSIQSALAFLLGCFAALSLRADQVVSVGSGTVRIPDEFKHVPGDGIDSFVGRIVSPDGRVSIRYDCGLMAGHQAKSWSGGEVEDYDEFQVGPYTATMAVLGGKPLKVIAGVGDANFFADVPTKDDVKIIRRLVASYETGSSDSNRRDNLFKHAVDLYIFYEKAGEKNYQRSFWRAFYRGVGQQFGVGWTPSEFRNTADMVRYIQQRRKEYKLPVYAD